MSSDLSLKLNLKHILLDTCFLAKAYQYSFSKHFDELFYIFKENHCVPTVNEFIKFEFLRGCKEVKHIKAKNKFLHEFTSLPSDHSVLVDAIEISNIYANKNISNNQISIVDCYISACLKKYNNNLLFVTLDNNDFPLIIHDRISTYVIDTEKELILLGFYKFNLDKYNKALSDLYRVDNSGMC